MPRTKVSDKDAFAALLRSDFRAFVERSYQTLNPGKPFLRNWHHKAIAYELERVRLGENNRLIINLQPRSLKSLMASVAFPAFVLGHEPNKRIIAISYGDELASKHDRDFRAVVDSPWYKQVFRQMRIARGVMDRTETTKHGFRMATSVAGSLTGHGADMLILDDPQKAADAQSATSRKKIKEWYSNTLISRLNDQVNGAIIVVMQRMHADDLCEYLMETSGDWTVLDFPAIAERDELIQIGEDEFYARKECEALHAEREPIEVLRRLQNEIGSYDFAAQYQQNPIPLDGGMIKREWIRYYDQAELPELKQGGTMIHSWDTAAKHNDQSSWSVCSIWIIKNRHYYLIHLERDRFDFPDLLKKAKALAERYKPAKILVEDASTGIILAQELPKIVQAPVQAVPVAHDKIVRLYQHQPKFEAGYVHFPSGASFLPELEVELFAFPRSAYTDQVDSITQALSYEVKEYVDRHEAIGKFYEALMFEPTLRMMSRMKR